MARTVVFFLMLQFLLSSGELFADEYNFPGFRDASKKIFVDGVSEIEGNGVLRLTDNKPGCVGHGFYQDPIRFKNSTEGKAFSFSTVFAFSIVPGYKELGGHGFAFTVVKSRELNGALPRQYLGLMNSSDVGNFSNHVFAVEFDTVRDFEFEDINDNHVGIDINSMVSNVSVIPSIVSPNGSTKNELNLSSGKRILAWIDYDSTRRELNVTLSLSASKPNIPILSFNVDLSPIFKDYMYVGFSASTGKLASSHYIFGWNFKINGNAQPLDLSSLPSIPGPKKNKLPLILGTCLSAVAFLVFAVLISLYIVKKIRNWDVIESWELDVGPHRFSYKELKKATRDFTDDELLGFGGFGKVYKGTLPDSNTQAAVKRINNESKQGLREFVTEIASMGRLRHRNLVTLLGWCRCRSDLLLVYDFMPNGSLDKYLFDEPKVVLTWQQRFKIIKGVAAGLLYLHEEWEQTVIHRDIKAANVLLDSEMNGRLGDFGLAKLYEHGSNPSTTKVVGTLGYLAPELTKTGKPTTSSDVFAFGALLLEVVCGRRPVEAKALPEELVLVDWVWDKWREGCILEVVDPRLKGEYDEIEAIVVIKLGLLCSSDTPTKRPTMRQGVGYLESEAPLPDISGGNGCPTKPGFEDSVQSYPSSLSYNEKVSTWSLVYDAGDDVDLEAGSTSPFSTS